MAHYSGKVQLNGAQNYELILEINRGTVSGNVTPLSWYLKVNDVNNWGSWGNYSTPWNISVGSASSGNISSFPAGDFTIASGTKNITHNSDGTKTLTVTGYWDSKHGNIGSGKVSYSITLPRIPKAPAQVTGLKLTEPSTTGMKATWVAPNNMGASITNYDLQYSTSSSMSSPTVISNMGTSLTKTLSNLTPGTTYYVQVRAKNSAGTGSWSAVASQTTLPAVPPGLSIVAAPSGTAATLTLTPPGGVTGVTKYVWERRVNGTTSPVATGEGPTSPIVVDGLTPGAIYDWRASAYIGTYQSPWTDSVATPVGTWLTVQQPNPNTSPGDYFDGDTTDKPDIDYVWTGTPGNSTSEARGKAVTGWSAEGGGVAVVLHQTTGGLPLEDGSTAGEFSARVPFSIATLDATFNAGTRQADPGWADVAPGGTYFASIYVYPSRPQLMAAKLVYSKADGSLDSQFLGEAQVVPANTWTRLVASAQAPETAEFANVRACDVDGPEWTPWLSGDVLTLDAAMISLGELVAYFDGNAADSADWNYEWEGPQNASISSATPVSDPNYNPFEDPNCPRPPRAPRPPVISDDCIVEVGTWQRYWSVIPEDEVTEWLTMVPTILLKVGGVPTYQIRVRLYPNPDNLPPEQFEGEWTSEQIVSYLPANSVMLIDGVDQRSWATIAGDAKRYAADHLLYGTGGGPATWPLLTCGHGYLASFDVPLDSPETPSPVGNLEVGIALTQRRSA